MASLDTRYMKYFHEGVTFLRKLCPKYDMRMLNTNQCCVQVVKPSFDRHAHFVTEVMQNCVPLLRQNWTQHCPTSSNMIIIKIIAQSSQKCGNAFPRVYKKKQNSQNFTGLYRPLRNITIILNLGC